jgi:hypothetical protein
MIMVALSRTRPEQCQRIIFPHYTFKEARLKDLIFKRINRLRQVIRPFWPKVTK